MEVYTEAFPHDWQGEVTCSACGTEHQADHASVRMVLNGRTVANDLCDDCIANTPELAANVLRRESKDMKETAEAYRAEIEDLKAEAQKLEHLADTCEAEARDAKQALEGGEWATLADLAATTREAKDYLAAQPPPPPEGWEQHYDEGEIPF